MWIKAPWYRPEDDFAFTMFMMEEENKNDMEEEEEEDETFNQYLESWK